MAIECLRLLLPPFGLTKQVPLSLQVQEVNLYDALTRDAFLQNTLITASI